jgi:ketosteroid isomerase-like protein
LASGADDFVEIGDHVVVLTRYIGRGRGSGVEIEQEGAHVFELRAGKVIRLEIYASRERALQYVHAAEADPARS